MEGWEGGGTGVGYLVEELRSRQGAWPGQKKKKERDVRVRERRLMFQGRLLLSEGTVRSVQRPSKATLA